MKLILNNLETNILQRKNIKMIELDIRISSVQRILFEDFFLIDNTVAVALLFIILG